MECGDSFAALASGGASRRSAAKTEAGERREDVPPEEASSRTLAGSTGSQSGDYIPALQMG